MFLSRSLAAILLGCLLVPLSTAAVGATRGCTSDAVVSNANDAGPGSLRAAVQDACDDGVVRFAERFVITLASEIAVDRRIILDGSEVAGDAGEDDPLVRIDGGKATRLFAVDHTGHLTLRSLRISNGIGENDGGGVRNLGTLVVQRCRFDGHRGDPLSHLGGGAIFSGANAFLLIEDSTFDGNGAGRGGAVFNSGVAEIYNSTFTGNVEGVGEGAIQNRGTLLGVHLTVTGNGRTDVGVAAGGLFAFNANTTLVNSVISGNQGPDCLISGGTAQGLALLVQNPQNCPADLVADAQLQPLAANGGPTRTHALERASPAIGAGEADFCAATDQRGVERQAGGPCSLGAFEARGRFFLFVDGFEAAGDLR